MYYYARNIIKPTIKWFCHRLLSDFVPRRVFLTLLSVFVNVHVNNNNNNINIMIIIIRIKCYSMIAYHDQKSF